ncbi:MAG: hypothetical protein P1V13_21135 [Rhizobiaceae bacterium]|nr:hypothetical protein [Rhizobiaceae bacterium]
MSQITQNGSGLKTLLTVGSAFGAIIVAAVGYGVLQHTVVANADSIETIEMRVDRIENRAGDVRERLTGIEVLQREQSKTLERILRAVER